MRVRHLLLPGLGSGHLDAGGLEELDRWPVRARARLVHSFGRSRATVEATLRCGVPPRDHGVLFDGEPPRRPQLLDETLHRRDDALLDEPTLSGQLRRLAAILRPELDELGPEGLLLVSSGPAGRPGRRVDLPESALADAGLRLRAMPAFALCEPAGPAGSMPPGLRDALLDTAGVARILSPSAESAGAWMAPADRGTILLPEPGWAFAPDAAPPLPGDPVLLAFGPDWPGRWPDAVHDWRVAPTLLAAGGSPLDSPFDEPLAGAERLRG